MCVSFSWTGVGLCKYYLFVWSNLNFLHNSQWITLPTQSYLFLFSFCVNLLHSLIMWLMVSYLSPHNLHLLFCFVLSLLPLIWLYHIHDTDMRNVHRMFITYIHRTQESRNTKNTWRLLSSGTKLFITFEIHTLSILAFTSAPTISCGARSAQIRLASASPESRPFSFGV